MNSSIKKCAGFTLSEVMVSAAIFVTCVAMALGAFFAAYKLFFFTRMLDFAHIEVRNASDRIAVYTRQALYYPQVYSNGVLSSLSVNVTNTSGGIEYTMRTGNEVRIMYEGTISRLKSAASPSNTTLIIENVSAYSSISTIPTVLGVINPSQTSISNQPVRLTASNYQIQPGDSLIIDASNPINANVTNTTVTPSNIVLQLDAPLQATNNIPSETNVFIGRMGKFMLTNGELRFYPLASDSSNYDVLIQNVTTDTPFGISGPMLTIDIKYASPGDITGKGIYRIITRATMRTDPKFRSNNYIATGGANTEPDMGMGHN